MSPKSSEENLYKSLFDSYEKFKELKLKSDFIRHCELTALKEYLTTTGNLSVESIGKSVENREITAYTIGEGPIKILAWSQMHGDEPTATAAIFDIIRFFQPSELFNDFRTKLLKKITVHFIPMLNPDGAEKYQRENIFNIDLNRDAVRRQSDESQILWSYAEKVAPDFGFNLHDQNSYYTAGNFNNPSAISLLAPPMNHVKSINYVREKSMQVICKIAETLSMFIPNKIARYTDDFEPRSFGDNFVKKGISAILIESGFHRDDPNKNFVRKLNYLALLCAFNNIADESYSDIDHKKYFDLPENQELLLDLILRNLSLVYNGRKFTIDVGIKREKQLETQTGKFYYKSKIAELGDLTTFYGIEEYDLQGMELISGSYLEVEGPANFSILKAGKLEMQILNGFILEQDHSNSNIN